MGFAVEFNNDVHELLNNFQYLILKGKMIGKRMKLTEAGFEPSTS